MSYCQLRSGHVLLLDLTISVKLQSKTNHKGYNRGGHVYLPKHLKALQDQIGWAAKSARAQDEPTTFPVRMELIAHFKGKRHADIDNLAKLVLDALQGIIYVNDKQIVSLHLIICECGEDQVTMRASTTSDQDGQCVLG